MSDQRENGRWALAGFLYQIVGVLTLAACASTEADLPDPFDAKEIGLLVRIPDVRRHPRVQHEWFGQDAVFAENDKCVLVQFKYSSTNRRVGRAEMVSIVRAFDSSVRQAEQAGYEVTACVLFTNRDLTGSGGRGARQYWQEVRSQNRYEYRYHRSGRIDDLVDELRAFARSYGLIDQEIEDGINRLIASVLRQTGNRYSAPIDQGTFVEHLSGHRCIRPLGINGTTAHIRSQLATFGEIAKVQQWEYEPIKRTALQQIENQVQEHALMGLCGAGGCGKTVLLWQLLHEANENQRAFSVLRPADDAADDLIQREVTIWRGLPQGTLLPDDGEVAIARLETANADLNHPILWLGLDGLDEVLDTSQYPSAVRRIIRWFWNRELACQQTRRRPLATLIVTCREESDLVDIVTQGQYDYQGVYPSITWVEDFTDAEVLEAARRTCPELYHALRLRGRPFGDPLVDSELLTVADMDVGGEPLSVDEQVARALRQPAVWRALLNLPMDMRVAAIRGEIPAKAALARSFLDWVHWKLRQRVHSLGDLNRDGFHSVLQAIARGSEAHRVYHRDEVWCTMACSTNHVSQAEAERLYREALSSGLIKQEGRLTWRWRHVMVHEYLVDFANGTG